MWSIRSAGTECTHKRDVRRPRLPAEGLDEADDVRHIDGGSNRRGAGVGAGVGPTSSPRIRPRRGVSGPGCGSRSQAGSVVLPRDPHDPHDPPRIPNLAMWARSGRGIPTRATHFDQTRVALVPARSRLERTRRGWRQILTVRRLTPTRDCRARAPMSYLATHRGVEAGRLVGKNLDSDAGSGTGSHNERQCARATKITANCA
jgi:hypothetical protein